MTRFAPWCDYETFDVDPLCLDFEKRGTVKVGPFQRMLVSMFIEECAGH